MPKNSEQENLSALLQENRKFPPSAEFRKQANWSDPEIYERAARDPEGFWAAEAKALNWAEPYKTVLEWNAPWAKWFVGGKLNVAYNCVDRHAASDRRNKAALIWEGEPGDSRVLTFGMLEREVNRFANVLKSLGVKKGDRVAIYMGMIPELPIAMLACAKIGAPHNMVFGGFSSEALRERINDAQAKMVITADGAWRRGAVVPLKASVDEALKNTPTVEKVIVVERVAHIAPASQSENAARPRYLVARSCCQRFRQMSCRADGCRGHAVYSLHERHHGKAERNRPHHRRLSAGRERHAPECVRYQRTRRLLVYCRYRLGHRTFLHRVWTARQRLHHAAL